MKKVLRAWELSKSLAEKGKPEISPADHPHPRHIFRDKGRKCRGTWARGLGIHRADGGNGIRASSSLPHCLVNTWKLYLKMSCCPRLNNALCSWDSLACLQQSWTRCKLLFHSTQLGKRQTGCSLNTPRVCICFVPAHSALLWFKTMCLCAYLLGLARQFLPLSFCLNRRNCCLTDLSWTSDQNHPVQHMVSHSMFYKLRPSTRAIYGGNWQISSFSLVTRVRSSGLCFYDISVWVSPALP